LHTPLSDTDFSFTPLPDLADDQRWSTWSSVEKGQHGPEPRPGWVVTDEGAVDTELGILKTGKEADVHLVERAVPGRPDRASVLAAKRYRNPDHRMFHRDAGYREGRRTRRSRDARAMSKGSAFGRSLVAVQWAHTEFTAMSDLWQSGVPVPYPVQVDDTEILMEYVEVAGGAAPRLAQARPDPDLLQSYFDQVRDAMAVMARKGLAHGDLSPYNILAAEERLVIIDLPQVLDIVSNPHGADYLLRDCRNVCAWFRSRGLPVEPDDLFAELVAQAW